MNTHKPISVIMVDNVTGRSLVNFCISRNEDSPAVNSADKLVKDLCRPTRNSKALAYLKYPNVTFVRGLETTPFATTTIALNNSHDFLNLFQMQNLRNFNCVKMKEFADTYREEENIPL